MSNDNRWHPENDDWERREDQSAGGEGGGQPGQDGAQGNPPTFGYFDRPADQPSYGEYSSYGQFGQASGDYQPALYGGYERSPFPLHPLTPMEQIDAAIRLVRYNPKVLVLLPLIVYLVVGLLSAAVVLIAGESSLTGIDPFEDDLGDLSTAFVVTNLITTLISFVAGLFIYTTAVNAAMSAIYGRKISIGQAISMSTGDAGRLAIAYIVYAVFFIAIATVAGLVLFPLLDQGGGGALVIVSLALFVAALYFAVRLSCVVPVLVAEQRGPIASIGRSFQLTKGRFWPIFATLIATFLLAIAVSIVLSIVIALFSFLSLGSTTGAIIYSTITGALLSAILVAITQAVTNVIYINLRMIRENFHYDVRRS